MGYTLMNSISIPTKNNRLLKPSEAFAILGKLQEAEVQQQSRHSTSQWFALALDKQPVPDKQMDQRDGHNSEGNSESVLGLLIPESCNKELLEAPAICQVPFTPPWLRGFITVRGQIAPVIDLMLFFDIRTSANSESGSADKPSRKNGNARDDHHYVLHFDDGGESFAISVRSLPRKFSVTSEQVMAQPPELTTGLKACTGTCYHHQGIWYEWNIEQFKRRLTQMLSHT